MYNLLRAAFLTFIVTNSVMSTCMAEEDAGAPFAMGGALGSGVPFSQSNASEPGFSLEGFYRLDPYEVRFNFSDNDVTTYSVVAGIKHFFSNKMFRPYVEAAGGPVIVDTPGDGNGLAYGIRPEITVGLDVGITEHISTGVVTRYFAMWYFGNTSSGAHEANHGLSILANLIFWF